MLQTLFTIPLPETLGGWPVFGVGLLMAAWVVGGVLLGFRQYRRYGPYEGLGWDIGVYALVGAGACFVLPRLVEQGGLPIRGYGAFMLLGVVSGVALAHVRARRMGLDPEIIVSLAFWMFISGIVGGRLFYVIEYWQEYRAETLGETLAGLLMFTKGGLVVYGALLAVLPTLAIFAWRHRLPGLALVDLIAPSMALGLAFGRIGCFMNGCCFGGPADVPWAVQFPHGSPPHRQHLRQHRLYLYGLKLGADDQNRPVVVEVEPDSAAEEAGVRAGDWLAAVRDANAKDQDEQDLAVLTLGQATETLLRLGVPEAPLTVIFERPNGRRAARTWTLPAHERSLPVHPAQLYAAVDATLLCFFLLAIYPYRRRDGEVVAWMLTIHPVNRFLLEIVRTDEGAVFGTDLSISQNVSLLILVGAAALWAWLLNQPKRVAWPAPQSAVGPAARA